MLQKRRLHYIHDEHFLLENTTERILHWLEIWWLLMNPAEYEFNAMSKKTTLRFYELCDIGPEFEKILHVQKQVQTC